MMVLSLITPEEARQQLRLDPPDSAGGADDAWLDMFIPAISEAVAAWLKDPWRLYVSERDSDGVVVVDSDGNPVPAEDSSGDPIVHPTVRAAVAIELASQYRFREGEGDNRVDQAEGHGYMLSRGATALLTGLRKPTAS